MTKQAAIVVIGALRVKYDLNYVEKSKKPSSFFAGLQNQCIRVRVTDRLWRHLRRKIKFGTKNHKLVKTSGEKNIT